MPAGRSKPSIVDPPAKQVAQFGSKTGCEPQPGSAPPPRGDPFKTLYPYARAIDPGKGLGCADTVVTRTSSPEVNIVEGAEVLSRQHEGTRGAERKAAKKEQIK